MVRFLVPETGRIAIAAGAIAAWAAGTECAEAGAPQFSAGLEIELEALGAVDTDSDAEVFNEVAVQADTGLSLVFPNGFGLHSTLVLEPVTDAEDDRYLSDLGLYAEELYLAGPAGSGQIRIGKVNLAFGLANDEAPGLFGNEIAGEYELTERLGIAVDVPLSAAEDGPNLSVAAFMADTTVLSGSVLTERDRLHRRDGGVSNTAFPESFLLALSGSEGETGYSTGLRYQATGKGDDAGEYSGVLGLSRTVGLADKEINLVGEAAYFPRFDGERRSAGFATLGAEIEIGPVALSVAYGQSWIAGDSDTRMATVAMESALAEGVTLGAGYRYLGLDGACSHVVGLRLAFDTSFP